MLLERRWSPENVSAYYFNLEGGRRVPPVVLLRRILTPAAL
jgi:hypothetical protein